MRFFTVWCFMAWKNLFLITVRQFYRIEDLSLSIRFWVLKNTNLKIAFALLHLKRSLRLSNRRTRNLALVAEENHRCLMPEYEAIDFIATGQRRKLLDFAATWGQNSKVLAQLDSCTAKLDEIVGPYHEAGKPIILAPMHTVSDILAGIVAGKVSPGHGTVVVSANAYEFQKQDRLRGGVNLTYCSIHNHSEGIGSDIALACMNAAALKTNIIIFPDMTPEYTYYSGVEHSSKLKCRLFNRPAHLHSGVSRLARLLNADVLFFNLYYDKGLRVNIFPVVHARDVNDKMPIIIERVIRSYPQDWILWHLHSLYFFNE